MFNNGLRLQTIFCYLLLLFQITHSEEKSFWSTNHLFRLSATIFCLEGLLFQNISCFLDTSFTVMMQITLQVPLYQVDGLILC